MAPHETAAIYRILDAAANRAREGLRVAEDYARFALDDHHLTERVKRLRHALAETLAALPESHLLACRDTLADVGVTVSTPAELRRADLRGVVSANFCRAQESLRSLEECFKLLDQRAAAALEALRYEAYTIHRALDTTGRSLQRFGDARLYVLLDGRDSLEEFRRLAASLVEADADVVQLRDKTLEDRSLLERARCLREVTRGHRTLLIVNDRPDLAALCDADGVHLGQEELPVKDARRIVGPGRLVGVSTHSLEQAQAAVLDGADYIGVGPTFPSGTKTFAQFPGLGLPGLDLLRVVAAEIRLPAFAIGGVTEENLPEILAAGFSRVAVGGGVLLAQDPAEAARRLRQQLAATPEAAEQP